MDSIGDGCWTNLISSLEERYGPRARVVENNSAISRPLEVHPGMSSVLDNIYRSPGDADYPLWRIRCRVMLVSIRVSNLFY